MASFFFKYFINPSTKILQIMNQVFMIHDLMLHHSHWNPIFTKTSHKTFDGFFSATFPSQSEAEESHNMD